MLDRSELMKLAKARIKDAEILFNSRSYDGASYLCGYAVEMALKARICKTLHWTGYPSDRKEFHGYQTFKTHDFNILLHLSGREAKIKEKNRTEWLFVAGWEPGLRYKPIGSATKEDVELMIESSKKLLGVL